MQKFSPIYIYTQSLDNKSDDLMYQITHENEAVVHRITDLTTAQNIMDNMNNVVRDKNLQNTLTTSSSNFIKEYFKLHKDFLIYKKGSQILIKLQTDDKDNLGRNIPIQILLNLSNIQNDNTYKYTNYFYNGFVEFCRQTGRNPKDKESLRGLPIFDFINHTKPIQKLLTQKMLIAFVIIFIIAIIFFVLK